MSEENQFQYKRYHIPNVVKALKALETLSESKKGMTQLELSRTCKFTQSIIFRLLCTLLDYKMLVKDPTTNAYTISKKFMSISYNTVSSTNIIRDLSDAMLAIRDEIGETTMLGIMLEDNFVMIAQELGKHNFNFTGTIGMKVFMHTAAPAKAALAFMDEDTRNKIVGKIKFIKFNERTIVNKKDYIAELETVKKDGYACDREEHIKGMNCLAIPVLDARDRPIASIWVTGPSDRMKAEDLEKYAEIMTEKLKQFYHK